MRIKKTTTNKQTEEIEAELTKRKPNLSEPTNMRLILKLQLHDAIYRLRFYSKSLIHILSLSNSHNNVASIQKNRGDKSHRVIVALGWGQIDEHCLSYNVGGQKLNHLTSHFNNVETCEINMSFQNFYFGLCQHFSPTNMFTETDLSQTSNSTCSWTQEAVNMAAPCWKLLWGWYVSGFKLMGDQEWAKTSVKSDRDVQFNSIRKKQA